MQSTRVASGNAESSRAWLVLLGSGLGIFSGAASVAYYTFGIFLPEIISDTRWSGREVAAAIGPALVAVALVAPLAGSAIDKFGSRTIVLIGAPAAAIGFAIVGLVPTTSSGFAIAMTALFLLYFAGSPMPYARLVAAWFGKRQGMALGVMFAFGSFGIAFWPLYAARLINQYGWRRAYVVIGITVASIFLLTAVFLLKDPPKTVILEQSSSASSLSVREAIRKSRFWKLAAIFLVITAVIGGAAVVFPVILRMRHADSQTSATIMAVIGFGMFAGRLAMGPLLDRFYSPTLTICVTSVALLSFAITAWTSSVHALFVAAGFLGLSLGSEYAVAAYMTLRCFGLGSFGSIYGLILAATSLGGAAGPAILGAALVSGIEVSTICFSAMAVLVIPLVLLKSFHRKDFCF